MHRRLSACSVAVLILRHAAPHRYPTLHLCEPRPESHHHYRLCSTLAAEVLRLGVQQFRMSLSTWKSAEVEMHHYRTETTIDRVTSALNDLKSKSVGRWQY